MKIAAKYGFGMFFVGVACLVVGKPLGLSSIDFFNDNYVIFSVVLCVIGLALITYALTR